MKHLIILLILNAVGFYSASSSADGDMAKAVIDKAIEGGFTELEKQIIDKYFKKATSETNTNDTKTKNKKKNKKKGLPPGLAKKEKLPPGLAKQLEKNGTLPPGLAKRGLPEDLETELPKPTEGLERTIVDNAVVLVEKATGRIIDIMKDVVTGN
ncbi:MAG: hypothetical protein ACI85N_001217 [Gammaproteobacteria bacterium]|jgi:hypothetical protein